MMLVSQTGRGALPTATKGRGTRARASREAPVLSITHLSSTLHRQDVLRGSQAQHEEPQERGSGQHPDSVLQCVSEHKRVLQ